MDQNYNLDQSLNQSRTFNALPSQGIHPGTNVWTGHFPHIQQLTQLNSQLTNMNIADTGTTYLDAYLAGPQNLNSLQNGVSEQYFIASAQPSSVPIPAMPLSPTSTGVSNNIPLATSSYTPVPPSNLNLTFSPNGQIPMKYDSNGMVSPLSPEEFSLYLQLQKNMSGSNVSAPDTQRIHQGTEPVPVTLPGPVSPVSNSSGSGLPSPATPRTPNNNTTRNADKRSVYVQFSETSSNASSTSIPGSPTSVGGVSAFSLPDSTLSPRAQTPEDEVKYTESRTGNVPIRSQSLKYTVRYPQDKCFKCMKKVYPMEKMGPVKEAVYHKGCFVCNVCNTRLNMKNYFLNKDDNFDSHLYCKTHQPVSAGKGADSNSVLIKGAMSVPKLSKVNEQIRGDKAYHIDQNAVEIRHAINVPVQDLHTANKLREKAWKREDRKSESVPPEDIVRYGDPVPEYDTHSYGQTQLEHNPDYNT